MSLEMTSHRDQHFKPLWTRNPENITQEEYGEFYKQFTNSRENFLLAKRFEIKQEIMELSGLLFVPIHLLKETKNHIKLYFGRDCMDIHELIPEYLNFFKGVVEVDLKDSIPKEMLQQDDILKVIVEYLVKRCIEILNELAENKEKYDDFYIQFSKNIKIGICEDLTNRQTFSSLLRYHTSASVDELCGLEDYVSRMKENQKDIYYFTGKSKQDVAASDFVKRLKKMNLEVIYMTDPIDEYVVQKIKEFDGKKMIAVMEGLELPEDSEEISQLQPLCKVMKDILDDKVETISVSKKLFHGPMKMRILKKLSSSMHLEINPCHSVIDNLRQMMKDTNDKYLKDLVLQFFDMIMHIEKQNERIEKQNERIEKQNERIEKQEERIEKQEERNEKQKERIENLENKYEPNVDEIAVVDEPDGEEAEETDSQEAEETDGKRKSSIQSIIIRARNAFSGLRANSIQSCATSLNYCGLDCCRQQWSDFAMSDTYLKKMKKMISRLGHFLKCRLRFMVKTY